MTKRVKNPPTTATTTITAAAPAADRTLQQQLLKVAAVLQFCPRPATTANSAGDAAAQERNIFASTFRNAHGGQS